MRITLQGGPCDGWNIPGDMFTGKRARVNYMPEYDESISFPNRVPNGAYYDKTDNESGVAQFVGLDGEKLPTTAEEDALFNALTNASNEDIVKLIRDVSDLEK